MEIGLEVWGTDYDQIEEACRFAEARGLDRFAYGESPHDLNLECWTVLASLARATERIKLGPVIANVLPGYRSALLLARQVETLSRIAPGRVELRTGVGAAADYGRPWWEPHGIAYPSYQQRLADLADALELWNQRQASHDQHVPVVIAATGERAMALTARHADVWETSFCTPEEYRRRRTLFDSIQATVAPGRTVVSSLEIDGFVASTSTRLAQLLDTVRTDRGASEDLTPVFDRALVGTAGQVAAHLDELRAAGVDHVLVALHDPLDLDAIATLAEARSALPPSTSP